MKPCSWGYKTKTSLVFQTLVTDSGSEWPSTSVFEINSYTGVPLDKIVIGKPLSANSASNGCVFPCCMSPVYCFFSS